MVLKCSRDSDFNNIHSGNIGGINDELHGDGWYGGGCRSAAF